MTGANSFYSKLKNWFFILNLVFTFLFFFLMSYSFSRPLRESITNFTGNAIIVITVYFFLFYLFYFLFVFILRYLEGFILYNRMHDKKQKFQGWFKELVQKEILTFSLLLIGVQVLYFFLETSADSWWIHMAVLSILVLNAWEFLPNWVVPYYSRHKDLNDKELKERFLKLAERGGIRILKISIYNDSKAKVVVLGLKHSRVLILSDAVLEYAPEEMEVLVALEIAKLRGGYVWKKALIEALGMFVAFLLVHFTLESVCIKFGFEFIFDVATLPVVLGLFFLFFLAIWFVVNYFKLYSSKGNDEYALRLSKTPEAFVSLIIRETQQGEQVNQAIYFFEKILFAKSSVSQRMMLAQDYAQDMLFENMHKA